MIINRILYIINSDFIDNANSFTVNNMFQLILRMFAYKSRNNLLPIDVLQFIYIIFRRIERFF